MSADVVYLFILYSNERTNNNRKPLVDIYQVKQEMGHSSVTTTEIYAKFSLRRLEMDFPSLTKKGKKPKRGYTIGGYNSKNISVNQVIKRVV